jgi:hypothetical protein
MRIFNIIILLFLLTAFAVGVSLNENGGERSLIDSAMDNASLSIENITLIYPNESTMPNAKGFFLVLEKYIKFIGTLGVETMRAGVGFGYDNPEYFSPEFILSIVKIICYLVIISLLIKPLGYLVVFLIMFGIMIKDKLRKKKSEK